MEGLLGETAPMNRLRGRWHEFNGIPLMATYHPAYLLPANWSLFLPTAAKPNVSPPCAAPC